MISITDVRNPFVLFKTGDISEEWKKLMFTYHPDKNPGREKEMQEICSHIGKMKEEALSVPEKIEKNGLLQVFPFEFGKAYMYREKIIYVLESEKDLSKKYLINMGYPDERAKENYEKTKFSAMVYAKDGIVEVYKKDKTYPLLNVLKSYGEFQDVHVAWIISRLTNIVCLFEFNGFAHNALTLSNCFVDLENHQIYPYGGWFFMEKIGQPLSVVSSETYSMLPNSVKKDKIVSSYLDMFMVREIGKALLGGGMMLAHSKKAPEPMLQWLLSTPPKNSYEDFGRWREVLIESFGKKKFVKFEYEEEKVLNV